RPRLRGPLAARDPAVAQRGFAAGLRDRPPPGQRRVDRGRAQTAPARTGRHRPRRRDRQRAPVAPADRRDRPMTSLLSERTLSATGFSREQHRGQGPLLQRDTQQEPSMSATATSKNFHQAELDKFDELAQRWWDPDGPQKA